MKISTFNRELNVYPELILSFDDNFSRNYVTWWLFETFIDVLSPLEIVVNTKRDESWNYFLSSILFRNNLDDFFYNLDILKINMTMDWDSLIFVFNDLNTKAYPIELDKELYNFLPWKINIEYNLVQERKILKSLKIDNYKSIIDQDSLKFTEYEISNT